MSHHANQALQADTLRPVPPPEEVPLEAGSYFWLWLAIASVAAILAWQGFRRSAGRKAIAPQAVSSPNVREEGKRLFDMPLETEAAIVAFHENLAILVARLVKSRLALPGGPRTSHDLLTEVSRACLAAMGPLTMILKRCDQVKYGKLRPGAESCKEIESSWKDLLQLLSPE